MTRVDASGAWRERQSSIAEEVTLVHDAQEDDRIIKGRRR